MSALEFRAGGPDVPEARKLFRREWAIAAGLIALLGVGLFGIISGPGLGETLHAIGSLRAVDVAVLLALSLVNYGLRGLRWHLFARRIGLPTTLPRNLLHFLAGFAMVVTPGRVGELVRMLWLRRETGWRFERTAPLALADRTADLLTMALLLAIAVMLSADSPAGATVVALLAAGFAILLTRPGILRLAANAGYAASGQRFPRLFARTRRAALSLRAVAGARVMLTATGLGIVGWLAEGAAFVFLLHQLGAEIDGWSAIAIFIFATLAGGLTGAPGGLGGAEAAMVGLLVLADVPAPVALSATLIIRATTLWFALVLGMCLFPLAERRSRRDADALEGH